ncbi:aspartyl aminopeptidase [Hypnocyclicus thermotrophus]|uniref:M18 family aminopeptidase n=1 Tax=Hypnocyclicus thermotrophus TaxID=1627895 RepID=A0AA46I7K6_9FUSO|nr:M18 family aminopeptidase [Hypnocyclicus thermotrophus]TDT72548.1 aspartyl aminopeptidase [Hypnocyclicus thermotrophus]
MEKEFLKFVYDSPTAFNAVDNIKKILLKENFIELDMSQKWNLEKKGKYFIIKNNSSLFAFQIGEENIKETGFKIIGSHTDSPGFKIKPNPEIIIENYMKLNIEVYGGPIYNTWLDRPLSIAGRIILKDLTTKIVNINKPLLIIPNLAIHQNREVNKGISLNPQENLLPIIEIMTKKLEKENYLLNIISKETEININQILDFELFLYEYDKGSTIGLNNEMISSSRIDNLASVFTSLNALINNKNNKNTKIIACFDNEEIGSTTLQGADSLSLSYLLEKICYGLELNREDFISSLEKSFIISADGAHAFHPNYSNKGDITNKLLMNNGIAIKYSSNYSYTSNAYSASYIKKICKENNIKYQYFLNRSDTRGGSTIGPISQSNLPINSVDIGIPMLAMHSIRELCGTEDLKLLNKLLNKFFEK